jgi:hypothetical protein
MKPFFNGRSKNSIKNRWLYRVRFETVSDGTKLVYTGGRAHRREPAKKEEETPAPERIQPEPSTDGRPFPADEDEVIMKDRGADPSGPWTEIARRLPGRSAQECTQRWIHSLATEIRSEPWTPEEDLLLVEKINDIGWSWEVIRYWFNGRSEDDIKSRWYESLQFEAVYDGKRFILARTDSSRTTRCPKEASLSIVDEEKRPDVADAPLTSSKPAPEQGLRTLGIRRHPFTEDEDAVILTARRPGFSKAWSDIAKRLPGRTARQCRDRWLNYLSPEIASEPWTPEEDQLLVEKINEMGDHWTWMTPFFNARSENDIKGRWYSRLQFEAVCDGRRFILTGTDSNRRFSDHRESGPLITSISQEERERDVVGPPLLSSTTATERIEPHSSTHQPPFFPGRTGAVTKRPKPVRTYFVFENGLKLWTQQTPKEA